MQTFDKVRTEDVPNQVKTRNHPTAVCTEGERSLHPHVCRWGMSQTKKLKEEFNNLTSLTLIIIQVY